MLLFQTKSSEEDPTIAVTGKCYVNVVIVQPAAGAEGWVQLRDTTDTDKIDDKSVKGVIEAEADKTRPFHFGSGNQGAFFSKGVSIRTENSARIYLGVTLVGDASKNQLE